MSFPDPIDFLSKFPDFSRDKQIPWILSLDKPNKYPMIFYLISLGGLTFQGMCVTKFELRSCLWLRRFLLIFGV